MFDWEQDSATPAHADNAAAEAAGQNQRIVDHAAFAARMKAQVASRHPVQPSSLRVRLAGPYPLECFKRRHVQSH